MNHFYILKVTLHFLVLNNIPVKICKITQDPYGLENLKDHEAILE